jgi:hypothetical protein
MADTYFIWKPISLVNFIYTALVSKGKTSHLTKVCNICEIGFHIKYTTAIIVVFQFHVYLSYQIFIPWFSQLPNMYETIGIGYRI